MVKELERKTVDIEVNNGGIYPLHRDITDGVAVAFRDNNGKPKSPLDVTFVNLSGGSITKIPHWVFSFNNAEVLNLFSNEISGLSRHEIQLLASMNRLKIIRIYNNHIPTIPDNIDSIKSLTEICIGDNGLTALPESIANLPRLRKLSIQSGNPSSTKKRQPNTFHEFSAMLLRMEDLRELEIGRAGITQFPDGVTSRLVSLERLDLALNPITELPAWLFVPGEPPRDGALEERAEAALGDDWAAIEARLKVDYPQISPGAIDQERREWEAKRRHATARRDRARNHEPQLRQLDVTGTQITALPAGIDRWGKNLEELVLWGSKIPRLPDEIGQ